MEKILNIKNLKVSFRTNNGTVKAVRGINLQLCKGQTLAIVGESGSGKSVTARAILGILSPNSIVESGEIIYDGKDLLKITEEEFHNYRGNRISMIFQDPMSSLNPIMTIGKQLTEAMLLNGKANQKIAKKELRTKAKILEHSMKEAAKKSGNMDQKEITKMIRIFKKYTKVSSKLEKEYEAVLGNAKLAVKDINYLIANKKQMSEKEVKERLKEIHKLIKSTDSDYMIVKDKEEYIKQLNVLNNIVTAHNWKMEDGELTLILERMKGFMNEKIQLIKPEFFSMGYYKVYNKEALIDVSDMGHLNKKMKDYLYDNYMNRFLELAIEGIKYSSEYAYIKKVNVMKDLEQALIVFEKNTPKQNELQKTSKHLGKLVEKTINNLSMNKEHLAYTFMTSLSSGIHTYYNGMKINKKESKRYEKVKKKYERAVARGKKIEKVEPPIIVDIVLAREYMCQIIKDLKSSYEKQISNYEKIDHRKATMDITSYLSLQVSKRGYKVTKQMARTHAISLMEEVGITDAKKRFDQFPFQFSGGMRQRIVIAIALASNPDILICDEPTTALDVTIQSQILELINGIKKERQLTIIFITHDLGVVANMADNIAVMYAGKIVEYGNVDDIFYDPKHPYTWALLSSMPDLDTKEKLEAIPGTPPNMIHPPVGDVFAGRNKYAMEIDFSKEPPLFEVSPTHFAATWLLHPYAPKVEPPKIVTERIKRMKNLEVIDNG